MPVIVCECKVGIDAGVKAKVAAEFTKAIREIILSPLDLISVVFHDSTSENTYRSGEPTSETLLFCHIRDGRSDGAILTLGKKVSAIWSALTGQAEDEIEVLITLYPAKYVVRGGERLPEAPRV
jgi:phenylpyruvate tautomerase PptA (4-oxalocrotonate tautomerase family)